MTNITRNIAELDYDAIKESFKTFLQSQAIFAGYDFEGDSMNVLLSTLAYNTHYAAFYMNMMASEMFIDSAQLRSSITSHCKMLGYLPRSVKAATALIDLQINATNSPGTIVIRRGTVFNASKDGVSYQFYVKNTTTVYDGSDYTAHNLEIVEGKLYNYQYVVSTNVEQNYVVPDKRVDIDLITVKIQNSLTDTRTTVYARNLNATKLDGTSEVYFIFENKDGFYEIQFGDGVLGKALQDGNIITIEYPICSSDAANGCSSFTLGSTIGEYSDVTITVNQKAFGGGDRQDLESIRDSAVRDFQTQNRCVTVNDFKAIIESQYNNADSVKVWGGEDNIPPTYGKVFISIKPKENFTITTNIKNYIKTELLKPYLVATVIPEIVDPDYTSIIIDSKVKYNVLTSPLSEGGLKAAIIQAISDYAVEELDAFDRVMRFSKFIRLIDDVNASVLSNTTSIRLRNVLSPVIGSDGVYPIYFNNAIEPGTLVSTGFQFSNNGIVVYLEDDEQGNVRFYQINNGTKVYVANPNVGTIDYTSGLVVLDDVNIYSTVNTDTTINITVKAVPGDLFALRNQVLILNPQDINVSMIAD